MPTESDSPSAYSLLARVQHHPSRADRLPALLKALAPLAVEVSTHASNPPNPWRGYQQCLSAIPAETTHVIVIQDDALLCQSFAEAVTEIVEQRPEHPICLFLGGLPRRSGLHARRAMQRNRRYAELFIRDFCPVVGMIWPREKAQQLLAWSQNARLPGNPDPRSDDAVVGRWMLETRQKILVTVPSLVEHPDDVKSIIGRRAQWGRDKGRVALFFIGDKNPLEFDWR